MGDTVVLPECPKCGAVHGEKHKILTKVPFVMTVRRWRHDKLDFATDGCRLYLGASECPHGHGSWLQTLKVLGLKGAPNPKAEPLDEALGWGAEGEMEDDYAGT